MRGANHRNYLVSPMAATISFAQVDSFLRCLHWIFLGRSFGKRNGWIDWKPARQWSTLLVGSDLCQASFIAGESTSKKAWCFLGSAAHSDRLV
jgi:hypothetical protein